KRLLRGCVGLFLRPFGFGLARAGGEERGRDDEGAQGESRSEHADQARGIRNRPAELIHMPVVRAHAKSGPDPEGPDPLSARCDQLPASFSRSAASASSSARAPAPALSDEKLLPLAGATSSALASASIALATCSLCCSQRA